MKSLRFSLIDLISESSKRAYPGIAAVGLLLVLGGCGFGRSPAVAPSAGPLALAEPAPALVPPAASAAQDSSPDTTHPPTFELTLAETLAPPESPESSTIVEGLPDPEVRTRVAPGSEDLTVVEVVKLLTPSIVQIVSETPSAGNFNKPVPGRGVGTGVILDTQGHILTNNHVVDGATSLTVTLSNGESLSAQVVGTDATTDTAVIRIQAPGLTPATMGSAAQLEVGEDVIAIGHALGLSGGPTVSKGVVSALGRSIDTDGLSTIVDLIQTDAAINPGNSGGPLVNRRAEVIGISSAIIQGSEAIGFAINIDDATLVAAHLIERGYVNRGFLGISSVNLNTGLASQLDLSISEGILVADVIAGSAADRAGLRAQDVIVKLGDEAISNNGELSKFLMDHPPEETVEMAYVRGRAKIGTQITLGTAPQN